MSLITFLLYSIITVIIALLGIIVFASNPKRRVNQYFFLFLLYMVCWIVTLFLYYTIDKQPILLYMGRFNFAFASVMAYFGLRFIIFFPTKSLEPPKWLRVAVFVFTILLVSLTSLTPLVVKSESAEGVERATVFGPLYLLWVLHFIFFGAQIVYLGIRKYFKSIGIERLQLLYFFLGVFLALAFGIVTNIILPIINITYLQPYGVFATLFITIPLYYSIIKHRFLNIRLVIGKSLYFLLLSAIPYGLFYLITYYETSIFGSVYSEKSLLIGFIQAPLFTAIFLYASNVIKNFLNDTVVYVSYNPIKYRDYFIFSTNNELNLQRIVKLLKTTLEQSVKPEVTDFVLFNKKGEILYKKVVSPQKIELSYELLSLLRNNTQDRVLAFNELSYLAEQNNNLVMRNTIEYMRSNKYELLLLTYQQDSFLGVIGLGAKSNFSAYDINDIRFLNEIIISFSVGVERSLLYMDKLNSEKILKERVEEATAQLRKNQKELQEKYQYEKDMMGIMGHELRTPMTVARGMAELMLSKLNSNAVDVEYYKDKTQKIHDSVMKESDLIQTMLSTSHVDNNKINLQLTPVNIEDLIEYSVSAFKKDAEAKSLNLYYEKTLDEVPTITTDMNRAQEIINNLVSNAVKYTNEGYVKVYLTLEGESICFNVEDSGIGIPKEEIANIGKKFYRIHQHLDKYKDVVRAGGTGLGLYVVKGVLKALGGDLQVVSEVGMGSTFTAVFPINFSNNENVVISDKPVDEHDMFQKLGLKETSQSTQDIQIQPQS